jgi:hypothetical protein
MPDGVSTWHWPWPVWVSYPRNLEKLRKNLKKCSREAVTNPGPIELKQDCSQRTTTVSICVRNLWKINDVWMSGGISPCVPYICCRFWRENYEWYNNAEKGLPINQFVVLEAARIPESVSVLAGKFVELPPRVRPVYGRFPCRCHCVLYMCVQCGRWVWTLLVFTLHSAVINFRILFHAFISTRRECWFVVKKTDVFCVCSNRRNQNFLDEGRRFFPPKVTLFSLYIRYCGCDE